MDGHIPHSLEGLSAYLSSKDAVLHYSCNSPDSSILKKNNVTPLGSAYGCADNREVVLIPIGLYHQRGWDPERNGSKATLTLWSEQILTALGRNT